VCSPEDLVLCDQVLNHELLLVDRAYLLADHSKFGVRSMTYSGDLQAVDVVITDDATDASFLKALGKAEVETEVVPRGNRTYGQETQPNTNML